MKQYIFCAALALGLSAAAPSAHAMYPDRVCGPSNQGEIVNIEQFNPWNNSGRIYVYQCYGSEWLLLEQWTCGDYGWGYQCIAV